MDHLQHEHSCLRWPYIRTYAYTWIISSTNAHALGGHTYIELIDRQIIYKYIINNEICINLIFDFAPKVLHVLHGHLHVGKTYLSH